jgi:MFS family permease
LNGLWRHSGFLLLWFGQTVSLFGSQITLLALPLAAALSLQATPAQMGILGASGNLPVILIALLAGVVVDRRRRRPILIATNIGRALCLSLIPLAALLGLLQIELLYAIAFIAGALGVLFDVAYVAYLPALVPVQDLVEGNSKLQVSQAAAQAAGPGLASMLVQVIGAPLAIAADALSFVIAAMTLMLIPAHEASPAIRQGVRSIVQDLIAGLKTVRAVPVLWNLLVWGALYNVCSVVIDTVFVFYVTRQLNITVEVLGVILALAGMGGIAGAALGKRISDRTGAGRAIIASACIVCVSRLLPPLASGADAGSVALLILAGALGRFAIAVLSINLMSIQQAVSPQAMLGRISGVTHVVIAGLLPLSALLGGGLGERIGVRATLLVGGLGAMFSLLLFWRSPLLALSTLPVESTQAR